jgi:AAA family ATP:ADP antiporter
MIISKAKLFVKDSNFSVAVFSFLCSFFIISSYYIVKPLRQPIIIQAFGKNSLLMFYSLTPFYLYAIVYLYGILISKFKKSKLVFLLFSFFSLAFLSFSLFILFTNQFGLKTTAIALIIIFIINSYILFLSTIMWSVIDDLFTENKARVYFPLIVLGSQLGSILGSYTIQNILNYNNIYLIFLVTSLFITISYFCLRKAMLLSSINYNSNFNKIENLENKYIFGSFNLAFNKRIYFIISLLTLFAAFGDFIFDYMYITNIERQIPHFEKQILFLAETNKFTGILNVFNCIIFLPIFLKYIKPVFLLYVYPSILLFSSILLFTNNSNLVLWRVTAIILTSTIHTVYNTSKEFYYIPIVDSIRYRLKAFNDTVVLKSGGTFGSFLVWLTTGSLQLYIIGITVVSIIMYWFYFLSNLVKLLNSDKSKKREKDIDN